MTNKHDPFSPRHIDEAIEHMTSPAEGAKQEPMQITPETLLVHDLHKLHGPEWQRYARALKRVEKRLLAQKIASVEKQTLVTTPAHVGKQLSFWSTVRPHAKIQQGSIFVEKQQKNGFARGLNLLVAGLVAAVLVGSLLVLLQATNHNTKAGSPNTTTATTAPTATPTSEPVGTIVKTYSNSGVVWSPDGKRMAVVVAGTGADAGLYIWDALTGANKVKVDVPDLGGGLNWSPNSKYLAINSLAEIWIADAQTGAILHTYQAGLPTAKINNPSGPGLLFSLMPNGGGIGFYALTWTPDSSALAAIDRSSSTADDVVKILNIAAGKVTSTLSLGTADMIINLAYSSDGQYLAGALANSNQIAVVQVATNRIVLQATCTNSGDSIEGKSFTWQPGTDNIAAGCANTNGLNWVVDIWNVTTQQKIKTYGNAGAISWSPDGKELAYCTIHDTNNPQNNPLKDCGSKVTIVDASTGNQVAQYTSQNLYIVGIEWSPDGKYIATGETNGLYSGATSVVIWTA